MKYKYTLLLATSMVLSGAFAFNSLVAEEKDPAIEAISKALVERYKSPAPELIEKSGVPGLYTIISGSDVVYMTGDTKYMIYGEIIDTEKRVNLTQVAKEKAESLFTVKRKVIMDKQDASKTISYKAKDEKHVLNVFTDIDCPYCVKFHNEMPKLNELGITVNYYLFPRAGLKSNSFTKAVSAWCADDPQKALTDIKNRKSIKDKECKNPIAEQYALGSDIGVTGTPSLITESGRLIGGYMPANILFQDLEANKTSQK